MTMQQQKTILTVLVIGAITTIMLASSVIPAAYAAPPKCPPSDHSIGNPHSDERPSGDPHNDEGGGNPHPKCAKDPDE